LKRRVLEAYLRTKFTGDEIMRVLQEPTIRRDAVKVTMSLGKMRSLCVVIMNLNLSKNVIRVQRGVTAVM
jgi:hypothetical protein